jgi:hypothetical protein
MLIRWDPLVTVAVADVGADAGLASAGASKAQLKATISGRIDKRETCDSEDAAFAWRTRRAFII